MSVSLVLIVIIGIISILFGLLVIAKPKILPILVGGYFIITGVIWILRALL
jgi:uncharacterized membrane protein HdeD (DUF308 family)